ncbi:MAG: acetyl-CoA decarbonylase/synthase complex subunit delta [Anaerolineae bacterium]|nr:acetyl-CoA decarbonylase/synthase complex subunit delta [Anaerolineae bacterium]
MPVSVEIPQEKYRGAVREVTLGAGPDRGGTRTRTVTVGGERTLPFLLFEGEMPHRPVVAVEIAERAPTGWSDLLAKAWSDVWEDPAAWAAKAEQVGADLLVMQVQDIGDRKLTAADLAARCKAVLEASGLPLLVIGPGAAERDNELLVAVADATAGERLALGLCEEDNYRTIVAAALANNHLVIASSPIDVNLAKQLNILIRDMNLPLDRVLMDPTTGTLGYGLEYTYSVMERLRLAALQGDEMTQQPMICLAGYESWRQKEARVGEDVPAEWGDWERRAVLWEAVTATSLLHSGADVVVLRHPESVRLVQAMITELMGG